LRSSTSATSVFISAHFLFTSITVKLHSKLYRTIHIKQLCEKATTDIRCRVLTTRKRKDIRKRGPKHCQFNPKDNIYVAKRYKSKMMSSQAAEQSQWEANLSTALICPDCNENPPNLEEEFSSGDMVCGSCGLVLGDRIVDTRSEWRTFSNDDQGNDDPSRVGEAENPLLNGSHLQTTIAFGEGSARARDLLRAQGKQATDKKDKTLMAAYKEIGAHCDAVGIPKNVTESAKILYKMADDAKLFKGKSTEAVIATCIFIACRQGKVARSFKELNIMTNVTKKEIGRSFKILDKYIRENKKTLPSKFGMKSDMCDSLVNYSAFKISTQLRRNRLLHLPQIFAFVSAVNSVYVIRCTPRSHKRLLMLVSAFPRLPVVPRYLLPQLVSIWQHVFSEAQSPQRKSAASLV